jgi:hypothetical protein
MVRIGETLGQVLARSEEQERGRSDLDPKRLAELPLVALFILLKDLSVLDIFPPLDLQVQSLGWSEARGGAVPDAVTFWSRRKACSPLVGIMRLITLMKESTGSRPSSL